MSFVVSVEPHLRFDKLSANNFSINLYCIRYRMKYKKVIALCTSLLLLNGCALLSREDCMRGSWYELGINDGRLGLASDRLERYHNDCSEYGVKVNDAEYQSGRKKGLENYCQLSVALETGSKGDRYQRGVCPPDIDATFYKYNDAAYQVYQLKDDIKSLERSIESKKYEISHNSSKLDNNNYTEIQKKQDELNKQLSSLQNERSKTVDKLSAKEAILSEFENNVTNEWIRKSNPYLK